MRISDWSSDVCSSDLGESISLTLFDDGFVVFVARSEVTRVVSTGFRIGIRAPAWNTAAGRVLLGALTDDEVRAYLDGADIVERTPHTVTDRSQLAGIVRDAKRQGFSINDEEVELGMRSLAVPRSEEHTSELQSLMRISYAVFCLK